MVTDHEVDDFLEHFGVRGMKWGRRKSRAGSSSPRSEAQRQEASANRKKNVKIAVGSAAVGAAVAAAFMAKHGKVRLKELEAHKEQLAKARKAVDKAMWQNPVHRNQAEFLRDYIKRFN